MNDDSTNIPEDKVVEGELVAPEGAEELQNITGLINTYINKIEAMTDSVKKAQEMLNDILDNDETYNLHSEKVKEANKLKGQTKQQIMRSPAAQDLAGKVKDARQSLKEMKDTLSEYLTEYARMSGSTEFEDETGQLRKIVYMAKLIKQ